MDFWTLTLIAIGGGILGALLVELLLWPLRAWQRRRAIADYAKTRAGKFVPNDWDGVGWIDEGFTAARGTGWPFELLPAPPKTLDPNETLYGCTCGFDKHAPCSQHGKITRTEREGEEGLR